MNILITGGAGFVGSHLTEHHLNLGHHVYVIDNLITGQQANIDPLLENQNLHFFNQDVIAFDFVQLPDMDVLYHLASPASPIQYKKYPVETMMVHSTGTHNLLEFMREGRGKRIVMASTSEVYGDPLVHPQVEEYWGNVNPNGVRSCYDEAKRFAEALLMTYHRKYEVDVRIARIFNTYGPHMEKNDGRVVSNFVMQALSKEPITIYGDGKQTRSFCYVSDLVQGLFLLGTTENISGKVINLGNPNEKTVAELAELVKQLTKSNSEIVYRPIDEDDPKKRKPDITKAQTILGWEPKISLEDGLEKTITYFRQRFGV